MVVDSMRGDSSSPVPAAYSTAPRGAEYHAFLSSARQALGARARRRPELAAQQVQGFLTDFFPWVKKGDKGG